jgi:cephalosporin hydroxylase
MTRSKGGRLPFFRKFFRRCRSFLPAAGLLLVIPLLLLPAGSDPTGSRSMEPLSAKDLATIEQFHRLFYRTEPFMTTFLGILSMQYPMDNWIMQEIIVEVKPDFIIETGTGAGGTALFYATVLEKVSPSGKIITLDINPHDPRVTSFAAWRERVEFIKASSVEPGIVQAIAARVKGKNVLVTLDSDHRKAQVLRELELYSPLVPVGGYLIVQDTHLSGHPNQESHLQGEGPWEAAAAFLTSHPNFSPDRTRERFLITQNPHGYLKRLK